MKLEELVRRQRGLHAMSFQDVSTAAGGLFTRSWVHSVEHGRARDPRVSEIMGLAQAFRIPPNIVFAAAQESQNGECST